MKAWTPASAFAAGNWNAGSRNWKPATNASKLRCGNSAGFSKNPSCAAKREASPFSRGEPKAEPKKPGRKPGTTYGKKNHRQPPKPEQIDETLDAPLPDACPHCGGEVLETKVVPQLQVEIPRQPIHRQFNVHIGHCRKCGVRVQGHHRWQTSDALGAAASQLGPMAKPPLLCSINVWAVARQDRPGA